MSRVAAKQAIANWISPPNVALISNVYPYPPKVTAAGEFALGSFGGTGGVIYVHFEQQNEKRIAFGGAGIAPTHPAGRKWRAYQAVLLCFLRSSKQEAEDIGADNDAMLDSLVARIEFDRQLGGTVFQAGEGGYDGGDDITAVATLPKILNAGLTEVFSTVRFQVAEILFT